jgi:hypothetical protein
MLNGFQVQEHLWHASMSRCFSRELCPDLASVRQHWARSLQDVIWALELAAHTGLGEIHKMLRIMQQATGEYRWSKPGMLPQAPRFAKISLCVMGNIQVNIIGQALNLASGGRQINMNKYQVDVSRAAQQEMIAQ